MAWLKTDCRLPYQVPVKRLFNTAHRVLTNRTLFCWYRNKKKIQTTKVQYRSVTKKNKPSNHGLIYWCWLNNQVWNYCKAEDLCIPLLLFIFKKAKRLSCGQAHYFQKDTSTTSLLLAGLASTLPANPRTPPALSLSWSKVLAFEGRVFVPLHKGVHTSSF